jgi:hypothetical protein
LHLNGSDSRRGGAGDAGQRPMAVLAEAGGKPEVGDGADMWARSVSDRKRRDERGAGPRVKWTKLGHAEMVRWRASEKRKEEGDLGRASCWATGCFVGRAGRVLGHKCARERERGSRRPAGFAG